MHKQAAAAVAPLLTAAACRRFTRRRRRPPRPPCSSRSRCGGRQGGPEEVADAGRLHDGQAGAVWVRRPGGGGSSPQCAAAAARPPLDSTRRRSTLHSVLFASSSCRASDADAEVERIVAYSRNHYYVLKASRCMQRCEGREREGERALRGGSAGGRPPAAARWRPDSVLHGCCVSPLQVKKDTPKAEMKANYFKLRRGPS